MTERVGQRSASTRAAACWPGRAAAPLAAASPPRPREIAAGVYWLEAGSGPLRANVYFVRSGPSWVLVDAGWAHQQKLILAAAGALFGPGARPAAILLTHIHPDHAGSARALAREWAVRVYVHPAELPMAAGEYLPAYANPLDRWLLGPVLGILPARVRARMAAAGSLQDVIGALDGTGGVPGLPDWEYLPAPGHTPGHIVLFRPAGRVLITGDAVLTVNLNSLPDLLRGRQLAAGPPRITSWDWPAASQSVTRLARLEPQVLAPGHGRPMTGPAATAALRALAGRLAGTHPGTPARPATAARRAATRPRRLQGFLAPVEYRQRTRYRRPPRAYLRLQWLGPLLTRLNAGPRDVITLEVPGRRTGVIHRTTLVRAACDGSHYLVALAGESEWVRNVRAADGRVVLGRQQRHAARLTEVPADQRAPVIRAYLLRGRRRPGSAAVAREARSYFGVGASASVPEIQQIVQHYPVFRITGEAA